MPDAIPDATTLEFAGLQATAFRDSSGIITIAIDTTDLEPTDEHGEPHRIPKIKLVINEDAALLQPDGSWEPERSEPERGKRPEMRDTTSLAAGIDTTGLRRIILEGLDAEPRRAAESAIQRLAAIAEKDHTTIDRAAADDHTDSVDTILNETEIALDISPNPLHYDHTTRSLYM